MGIADRTGTLEPGKMADVVLWNGNPFSVYAHAEKVYIDGARVYDRDDPSRQPESEFMLGQDAGQGRAGGVLLAASCRSSPVIHGKAATRGLAYWRWFEGKDTGQSEK